LPAGLSEIILLPNNLHKDKTVFGHPEPEVL